MRRILVIALAMLFGAAAAQNISFVGTFSSLNLNRSFEAPFWGETVPELVPGITTETNTFDQMGLGGDEVLRLLGMGLYDVGATVADYVVSDAPVLEGLDLPMLAPDIETARQVAEAYKPVLDEAMQEAFDAKLISIAPYTGQVVFCNREISSLADMQGVRVRASGRSTAEFLDAIGATGVTLAFGEVPQALQQGVVDCAITGSTSGYAAGWYDVATHLYPLYAGGWDYVVTGMSLSTWNQLGSEQQDALMAAVENEFEAAVWAGIGEETQQGINCLTGTGECTLGETHDMVLVEVSEQDVETARQLLSDELLPLWASRVDDETVQAWNDTIGAVVGLTATQE